MQSVSASSDAIERAADALVKAKRLVALTGAGLSAESGVPTFRAPRTGYWARYDPADLASPEAFRRHPARVWAWYQERRRLIARGGPNAAHRALVSLARDRHLTVVTQNVDGLHALAGQSDVAELHGNLWRERCAACATVVSRDITPPADDAPGICPACGAMTRPDVVWFGETLPMAALDAAEHALTQADAVLVIGTSSRVYPAAALVDRALCSSVTVVEVNPAITAVSRAADIRLAQPAGQALPALVEALDAPDTNR